MKINDKEVKLKEVMEAMDDNDAFIMFSRLSAYFNTDSIEDFMLANRRAQLQKLSAILGKLPPYDLKVVLCDALSVPCYYDDEKLSEILNEIVHSK